MKLVLAIVFIAITIGAYIFSTKIHQKFQKSYTTPFLIALILLLIVLSLFNVPYETYMDGGKLIDHFLGTAIVALAFPLYEHRKLIKEMFLPFVIGTLFSTGVTILFAFVATKIIGQTQDVFHALVIKSVTMPIALELTNYLDSNLVLTILLVPIAGIFGAVLSPLAFKFINVSKVSQSVALGSNAHGLGVVKALEFGTFEAAVSTVSMILTAIFTSVIIFFFF